MPVISRSPTRRSGRARPAYGACHAVPLRPPIAVTLVQYAHHLVPYQIIFNVPRAFVLLDHIVDRRIDRCLVGDAHFKDLQRMPFSLRSFDELSFDSAISGTSRMVATTEVIQPCQLQYRQFSKKLQSCVTFIDMRTRAAPPFRLAKGPRRRDLTPCVAQSVIRRAARSRGLSRRDGIIYSSSAAPAPSSSISANPGMMLPASSFSFDSSPASSSVSKSGSWRSVSSPNCDRKFLVVT